MAGSIDVNSPLITVGKTAVFKDSKKTYKIKTLEDQLNEDQEDNNDNEVYVVSINRHIWNNCTECQKH